MLDDQAILHMALQYNLYTLIEGAFESLIEKSSLMHDKNTMVQYGACTNAIGNAQATAQQGNRQPMLARNFIICQFKNIDYAVTPCLPIVALQLSIDFVISGFQNSILQRPLCGSISNSFLQTSGRNALVMFRDETLIVGKKMRRPLPSELWPLQHNLLSKKTHKSFSCKKSTIIVLPLKSMHGT